MNNMHAVLLVAISAAVTAGLRFLPFLIFGRNQKTPDYIVYLGRVLPLAIMGMLVVYCLKGVTFAALDGWLPALLASAAVVGLHVWKRNTLLSILGGTVLYMLLIQLI